MIIAICSILVLLLVQPVLLYQALRYRSTTNRNIRTWLVYVSSSIEKKTKLNSVALVHERTIPTERPPSVGEVCANFLRIVGCHTVSATVTHGHFNLCFLDRSRYFLFK